jgi:hypothetical protein
MHVANAVSRTGRDPLGWSMLPEGMAGIELVDSNVVKEDGQRWLPTNCEG